MPHPVTRYLAPGSRLLHLFFSPDMSAQLHRGNRKLLQAPKPSISLPFPLLYFLHHARVLQHGWVKKNKKRGGGEGRGKEMQCNSSLAHATLKPQPGSPPAAPKWWRGSFCLSTVSPLSQTMLSVLKSNLKGKESEFRVSCAQTSTMLSESSGL